MHRTTRKPLTAGRQALAVRYLPLARSLAKPYKLSWPASRDDFESAAMLALVEAAEAFDEARNVKFATFARHRIWGALRDVQRGMVAYGWRNDAANAPAVGGLPADPERHGRVIGSGPDRPVDADLADAEEAEALLATLPARHAEAMRAVYLEGRSQNEAALAIGCSQSRLSYIHREAVAMLDGSWARGILSCSS